MGDPGNEVEVVSASLLLNPTLSEWERINYPFLEQAIMGVEVKEPQNRPDTGSVFLPLTENLLTTVAI